MPASDDDRFDDFFRAWYRGLVGSVMAQGASLSDAEDAAQEAMVLLRQRWERINAPTGWTRRVAARIYRRTQLRQRRLAAHAPQDGSLSPDPGAVDPARLASILSLLQYLPPSRAAGPRTVAAGLPSTGNCHPTRHRDGHRTGTPQPRSPSTGDAAA